MIPGRKRQSRESNGEDTQQLFQAVSNAIVVDVTADPEWV